MKLSKEEIERYARHLVLTDVGGIGQQKLKQAKVLVIGAGGLGSPLMQYLAAAGIGTIGIIDGDVVSLSNLQRQTIHPTRAVGDSKVESAKAALKEINPHVEVSIYPVMIGEANGDEIVQDFDVIADGSDNFGTRHLVADLCEKYQKPLVTAAVGQFDATITTLKPYLENSDGEPNPRYRDIFPKSAAQGSLPTCEEAGIIGALTGIMGSMQALEIIKEITDVGDSLVGRLVLYDAKSTRFQEISYARTSL